MSLDPNGNTVMSDDEWLSVPDHTGEFYHSILHRVHHALKPKTYFEIGTLHGTTFALAKCASLAVDPGFRLSCDVVGEKPACLMYQETSDDFFAKYNPEMLLGQKVDFAFLDGLHHFEYLLRDFMNIEPYCHANSIVALHDCIPTDLHVGRRNPSDPSRWPSPPHPEWWAGDVWKTLVILTRHRPDLKIYALDAPPTGLVLITNLDPSNNKLKQDHDFDHCRVQQC